MNELLKGPKGVAVYMDDVIVHGKDMIEHNKHLQSTLERMELACLKLNKEKCVHRQSELCFLGLIVDACGVRS